MGTGLLPIGNLPSLSPFVTNLGIKLVKRRKLFSSSDSWSPGAGSFLLELTNSKDSGGKNILYFVNDKEL